MLYGHLVSAGVDVLLCVVLILGKGVVVAVGILNGSSDVDAVLNACVDVAII